MPAPGPEFVLFGTAHLVTLALVVAASFGLPLAVRRLDAASRQRWATGLALFLVVYRIAHSAVRLWLFESTWQQELPLHICGILFFFGAWMVWKQSYAAYEVVYFWSLAGTVQALITPDVAFGYPHLEYVMFYVSHGVLVLTALFATFVFGFRPTLGSVWRAMVATNVYAAIVALVNLPLGTNYLYLRGKPASASMLDFFGPWPWYLLVLEVVALLSFLLWLSPFALGRWVGEQRWAPISSRDPSAAPPASRPRR